MTAAATIRAAAPADLDAVLGLVREAGLAEPGIAEHLRTFLVAERNGRMVGAMGLELRGRDALLRSAVVSPSARGQGVGRALFDALLDAARQQDVRALYLLTTDAEGYWSRLGFAPVARTDVPAAVRESAEFVGACPASAAAMHRPV